MKRRGVWVLAGMAALLAVGFAALTPVSRGIEAAILLFDFAAGTATAPVPESVSFRVADRDHAGDLYRPKHSPLAAVALIPGALAAGKNDPRLIAFAAALARARFAVIVPDIPAIRNLRLRAGDARDIADTVAYLAGAPEWAGRPIGVIAFSYAAGPALIAVLDPSIGAKVRFVVAVGPYYDSEAVLAFFTTGYYRDGLSGARRHIEPNAYGKWLFVAGNAELVADARDRAALLEIARRKLNNLDAGVADLASRLGSEGRRIFEFVSNTDPDRAAALFTALPESMRAEVSALDLKRRDISSLQPRLIIVHGRDDAIIPYTESVALQAAAPKGRAELYLIEHLAHVNLGPPGVRDAIMLWRANYRLLEERDG